MLSICHAKRRSRRRWGFHPSTCSLCDSALDALVRISSRRAKGYTHEGLCVCFPTHSIFFCFVVIVVFAFESSFRGAPPSVGRDQLTLPRPSVPGLGRRRRRKKRPLACSSFFLLLRTPNYGKIGEREENTHTHTRNNNGSDGDGFVFQTAQSSLII